MENEKTDEIMEELEIKNKAEEESKQKIEKENYCEIHINEEIEDITIIKEQMNKVMDKINHNNCADIEKYQHLYYGNAWYIATGESNELDMYMGEKTTEEDREIIREVIRKMMEETEKAIKPETEAESEIETISMERIAKCTDNVTGPEKESVMSKLKRLIEIEKILKPEDENMLNAMDMEKRE